MLTTLKSDFARNPRILSRLQLFVFRLGNWAYYRDPGPTRTITLLIAHALKITFILGLASSEVPFGARIGAGLRLPHGFIGVVVNSGTSIGTNATIYQHVTIGSRTDSPDPSERLPVIGDNVVIFSGAVVAGAITIGDNATIGANAVVVKDVPAGMLAVGVPAQIRDKR